MICHRDIKAGEELTFNYQLQGVEGQKRVCECGAPGCVGFIGEKVRAGAAADDDDGAHAASASAASGRGRKSQKRTKGSPYVGGHSVPAMPKNAVHDLQCNLCAKRVDLAPDGTEDVDYSTICLCCSCQRFVFRFVFIYFIFCPVQYCRNRLWYTVYFFLATSVRFFAEWDD